MNVNSSSSYSVSSSLSATNNGLTGLASGIDTDSVVEQMLSGIKSNIEKQQAKQTQTEWKQEMYRDVISTISDLQSTYLDSKYDADTTNNLANKNFFKSMKSVSSGDAVSVVGTTSSAAVGDMNVMVGQLAEAASVTGDALHTECKITGSAITESTLNDLKRTITFDVNDGSGAKQISVDFGGVSSSSDIASAINTAFQSAGVSSAITADVSSGKLTLKPASTSTTVSLNKTLSTTAGLEVAGMTDVTTDSETGSISGTDTVDAEAGVTITVMLDGVSKELNIAPSVDASGNVTKDLLLDAVQSSLKNAFGSALKVEYNTEGAMVFELGDSYSTSTGDVERGHQFSITGADASYLGIKPGSTSGFNTSMTLEEMGLSGSDFEFSINGHSFQFDKDTKVSAVLSEINSSKAGVTIGYSSFQDQFTIKANDTGSAYGIEIQEVSGNFLDTIFGSQINVNAKTATSNSILTTESIAGTVLASDAVIAASGSLDMQIAGKTYTFTLDAKGDGTDYTAGEIETKINEWLKSELGDSTTYQYSIADGKINTEQGDVVAIANGASGSLAEQLGLSGKTNVATGTTTLDEIVQLQDFVTALGAGSGSNTLDVLTSGVEVNGATIGFQDGVLSLTNNTAGDITVDLASYGLDTVFGETSITLSGTNSTGFSLMGKDAKITVNGIETSRSSNTFTIDGITMTANAITGTESVKLSTSQDIDTVVEGVKKFVESYNAMVDKLNKYTDADKTYMDYAPLTSAQEDEMSETEIEKWNAKAKEGLLHRDSTIESFLGACRSLMYTKPTSSNFALYQIGVETGSYKEQGKLYIDEDALRSAISADPDSVMNLFTDSKEGIGKQLETLCDTYVSDSYGSTGLMVLEAGIDGGTADSTNNLSTSISSIKQKISDLQDRYDRRKEALWKKMTNLETSLSNFNNTSSYLTSFFS